MFYVVCSSLDERTALIEHLKKHQIYAVFHYLSLHKSEFYAPLHDGAEMPNSDRFTDQLLRLPLFFELSIEQIHRICSKIREFYGFSV